jgi:hypothetical protein
MKYTIIMTYTYAAEWLQKTREQREAFNDEFLNPLFGKYMKTVKVRFFDAEAFEARFSDFVIFETEDLKQYYFLIEELRDSPLFAQRLAKVEDIFMGIEGGYQEFEKSNK